MKNTATIETGRQWSIQQENIFVEIEKGTGNVVVRARAGTGKTTTILEAINRAPAMWTVLVCAFNKSIADELTLKLRNPKAQAKTLHAVGFRFVLANWRGCKLVADRGYRLATNAWSVFMKRIPDAAPDTIIGLIVKLAGLGKNTLTTKAADLVELAYAHSIVPENGFAEEYPVENIASMAEMAIQSSLLRDGTLDFDDMIFLPVMHGWVRADFDMVVVDEAQDMNPVQLAMAQKLARKRIVVVGDDKQAIYAFRGADSNALDNLKSALNAKEFPLTITYRCPKSVVAEALPLCPDYIAAPSAPEGQVLTLEASKLRSTAEAGDFILSRTNAPLAPICLSLLREGRPAVIKGRDMAKSLITLVKRYKVTTMGELLTKLEAWRDREIDKLTGRKNIQARVDYLTDVVETIDALSDGCASVAELIARIENIFSDNISGAAIMLSTIHKAKGLEAKRVFLMVDTLYCNGKRVNQEEQNIHYVGVTRAKETLVKVTAIPAVTTAPVAPAENQ